jgi:hypothetical protein
MIKLFNNRLLLLICFILSIGLLSSCEKDDETSTQVELLSFGPTGAKHGDTLRFIGNNLNKVTEIQFTGKNAVVAQKDFKLQTNEEIKVIVPTTAEQGVVTLKTPEGNLVSKSKLNLGVEAVVTSVTAEARPGTNITITGDYLNWVKRVTFARDKVVSSFVSQSQNELVLTVPEDAQTGSLMIFYGGTDSMEVETDQILNVTLPAITGIAPTPVRHESNVTITGTNLDLVKEVIFSGVSTPVTAFESKTATQLVVKVPRSTTKGKITLKVASGVTVQSSTDLDVVLPVITNMTPNPVDPGANLTITGTNLDLVKGISFVGVTNEVTTFVSKSATQIVVTVPTGSVTGKPTFTMTNSTLSVKSTNDLAIVGSAVPPIIIYDDVTTAAWNGWTGNGWGGTKDVNNTSPVRSGSKSVKIDYTSGGYGVPWQLGGANISLGGYTSLKVSIYGGAGSNGKSVNIGFNEQDGKTVTLVEGQWTDFTIPLSQISTTSTLTHLYIKNYSATGAFTIYVDNLGLY